MGIPGAGKTPGRRASTSPAATFASTATSAEARCSELAARARRRALRRASARVVLDNTYLTRAARSHVIEAASRHRDDGAVRVARHPAGPGPGQPRRAPARPVRRAPDPRRAARAGAPSTRACSRRRRRCGRSASSSRRRPTRASPASKRSRSRARPHSEPVSGRRRVRRRGARSSARAGEHALEQARPATPRTSCSTGARAARRRRSSPMLARLAAAVDGPGGGARCARTPAAPRPAGAGRRCRDCRSRSRAPTVSTRRGRR